MTLVHIDPRNILPSGMVFQPLPTDESCISRPLSYRVRNYALEMIGDLRKDLDNDEHLTLDDLKAIRHISILLKPHINVLAAMIGDNSALDDAASLLKESLRDLQGALQSLRDDLEQSCSFTKDQLKTLIKTEISYSEERLRNPNRLEAKIASIPNTARFLHPEEFSSLQLIYKFFYNKLQNDPCSLCECDIGIILYVNKFLLSYMDWLELDKRDCVDDRESSHPVGKNTLQIIRENVEGCIKEYNSEGEPAPMIYELERRIDDSKDLLAEIYWLQSLKQFCLQ